MRIHQTIREIMTTDLVVVSPDTLLDEVNALFETHTFHHLPVVEKGHLVGIISRIDVSGVTHCATLFHSPENAAYNQRLLHSLRAEEVMTRHTTTIAPDDTPRYAANLLLRNQFHALPVVVGDRLVGLVTTYDLLKACFDIPILT
jgi:CBS domain-containing protein